MNLIDIQVKNEVEQFCKKIKNEEVILLINRLFEIWNDSSNVTLNSFYQLLTKEADKAYKNNDFVTSDIIDDFRESFLKFYENSFRSKGVVTQNVV